MIKLLFLCTRNSCRSQMAEGFARHLAGDGILVQSAGTNPSAVHPLAVRVMTEAGMDISGHTSKSIADLGQNAWDVVVTLCDQAAESCPILPGSPVRVDWSVPDPAAIAGDEAAALNTFREARDLIRRLVEDLFQRGYFPALVEAKRSSDLILDNISDGILAHDLSRRIFHFNRAAERITGYLRDEVVNRDCHEVFPGGLCGGKCLFQGEAPPHFEVLQRQLEIVTKSGEKRHVDMTIRPMTVGSGASAGVLISFHDYTREYRLARRVGEIEQFAGIIGRDEKMLEIFDLIRDLADSNVPVLIEGESGTGKELVAAAIHNEGPRAGRLFVPVNCGALPETLLESELFGHVRGAFTGAIRDKKGRFELADGGTIFLDEIGDISPSMQVRLLRVLQEGTFERVGSEETLHVNVRVISATNKDIRAEIEAGRFRDDVFYRLSVVPVSLPPLRERRNDIPLLLDYLLKQILKQTGRSGLTVSAPALDIIMSYDWPGNVRELQNWLQFALVKCKGSSIGPEHLPPTARPLIRMGPSSRHRKLDASAVRAALEETRGNKVEAARVLGVSRATLYRFLSDAGMTG